MEVSDIKSSDLQDTKNLNQQIVNDTNERIEQPPAMLVAAAALVGEPISNVESRTFVETQDQNHMMQTPGGSYYGYYCENDHYLAYNVPSLISERDSVLVTLKCPCHDYPATHWCLDCKKPICVFDFDEDEETDNQSNAPKCKSHKKMNINKFEQVLKEELNTFLQKIEEKKSNFGIQVQNIDRECKRLQILKENLRNSEGMCDEISNKVKNSMRRMNRGDRIEEMNTMKGIVSAFFEKMSLDELKTEKTKSELEDEVSQKATEITIMQLKLEGLKKSFYQEIENMRHSFKLEIESLQQKHENSSREHIEKLSQDHDRQKKELQMKFVDLNSRKVEIEKKNIELNMKNIEISTKNDELCLKTKELRSRIKDISKSCLVLNETIAELKKEMIDLRAERIELNDSLKELKMKQQSPNSPKNLLKSLKFDTDVSFPKSTSITHMTSVSSVKTASDILGAIVVIPSNSCSPKNKTTTSPKSNNIKIKTEISTNNDVDFKLYSLSHWASKFVQNINDVRLYSMIADDFLYISVLNTWILEKIGHGDFSWQLEYKATRDGFSATSFHQKCNNLERPTVCLIKTTNGSIFGGFTTKSWSSEGVYVSDDKAFCFSLFNSQQKERMPLKIPVKDPAFAIWASPVDGPCFGSYDLCAFSIRNFSNTVSNSNTFLRDPYDLGSSFSDKEAEEFMCNSSKFQTAEIEVFSFV